MRGILFTELERFVAARGGADVYDAVVERLDARLTTDPYVTPGDYPAEELVLLVAELARELATAPMTVWREFGSWSFAPLGTRYRMLAGRHDLNAFLGGLDRALRTELSRVYPRSRLDYVEIHYAGGTLRVTYREDIPDCAFVRGLLDGMREQFQVPLVIEELTCRKLGACACEWEARVP